MEPNSSGMAPLIDGTLNDKRDTTATRRSTRKRDRDNVAEDSASRPQKRSKPSSRRRKQPSNPMTDSSTKVPYHAVEQTNSVTLRVVESVGDIFDASPSSILIHACNCEGSWGAGIAKAFKDRYPDAFEEYARECSKRKEELRGHALLIAPQNASDPFVGCLFTSNSKGKKKDSPKTILQATSPAMKELLQQISEWNTRASHDSSSEARLINEIRMCKINSGLFKVPWEKTKAALESLEVEKTSITEIKVISIASS